MQMRAKLAEIMFGSAYGITPGHDTAFRRRLEHLRTHGCPVGLNTGRGKTAFYGWEQLIQQALALDLIDAGLTPEKAAGLVVDTPLGIMPVVYDVVVLDDLWLGLAKDAVDDDCWPAESTTLLFAQMHTLAALNEAISLPDPTFDIVRARDLYSWRNKTERTERAGVVIDFGSLLATLLRQVADFQGTPRDEIIVDFYNWVADYDFLGGGL